MSATLSKVTEFSSGLTTVEPLIPGEGIHGQRALPNTQSTAQSTEGICDQREMDIIHLHKTALSHGSMLKYFLQILNIF